MEFIFKRSLTLLFVFAMTSVNAQEAAKHLFRERGGLVGAGYGINNLNIPEGRYTPIFFIAHFGIDLFKPAPTQRQIFTLFLEPQINAVVLQRPGTNARAGEFGLNVGMKHMYPLRKNLYLYALISTGPHYITAFSERQAHGFIFSDNMGAGTYIFLTKSLALNTGMRIRHMSNANTRMPNHGINTMNYFIGISHIFR